MMGIEFGEAAGEVGGVTVFERFYGALEQQGRILQGRMGELIDEGVGDLAAQCLGHGDGREIAVGQQGGGFGVEEAGEGGFELGVNGQVAGGAAGGGGVQAVLFERGNGGSGHARVAGEAEVVAAGEIEEPAAAQAYFIESDKF